MSRQKKARKIQPDFLEKHWTSCKLQLDQPSTKTEYWLLSCIVKGPSYASPEALLQDFHRCDSFGYHKVWYSLGIVSLLLVLERRGRAGPHSNPVVAWNSSQTILIRLNRHRRLCFFLRCWDNSWTKKFRSVSICLNISEYIHVWRGGIRSVVGIFWNR